MVHKMEGDHASSITVMKTQAKKMSMEVEGLKKALEQKVEWGVLYWLYHAQFVTYHAILSSQQRRWPHTHMHTQCTHTCTHTHAHTHAHTHMHTHMHTHTCTHTYINVHSQIQVITDVMTSSCGCMYSRPLQEIEKGELASICDELVKEIHKRQK